MEPPVNRPKKLLLDVLLAEDAGADRPVHVLECGIIEVLGKVISRQSMVIAQKTYLAGDNEGAEEHPFVGPLLHCNLQERPGTIDVHKGSLIVQT